MVPTLLGVKNDEFSVSCWYAVGNAADNSGSQRQRKVQQVQSDSKPLVDATDLKLERSLRAFLAKRPFILQASVVGEDGNLIVSVLGSGCSPPRSEALQDFLRELTQSFPRPPIKRVIIEDALGTVVAAPMNGNQILVVVTEPEAKLGAVSMTVERFLRTWSAL